MLIVNAIRRLERAGWITSELGGTILATHPRSTDVIELSRGCGQQGTEVMTIRVRGRDERDDLASDYFAGSFVGTLAQALRMATIEGPAAAAAAPPAPAPPLERFMVISVHCGEGVSIWDHVVAVDREAALAIAERMRPEAGDFMAYSPARLIEIAQELAERPIADIQADLRQLLGDDEGVEIHLGQS